MSLRSEKSALNRAARVLGGQAALARVCGFADRRNVWPWFATDRRIPAEHCPAIELATDGKVTCEQLRGDVVWARVHDTDWPGANGRPTIDVAKSPGFMDAVRVSA